MPAASGRECFSSWRKREPIRRLARRALFAIGLFLILQEGAFRLVFPVPEVVNFHRINYSPKLFRSRDILPATLGHASFTWSSDPDEYEFVHRLNLYGFRDDTWKVEREAGTTRVAFIGDSFVEGFGSDGPNTLPAAFGRRARESGLPVEVLNLGVGELPARVREPFRTSSARRTP